MSTSNLCQRSAHVVQIGNSFLENPFNVADINKPLSDLTEQYLSGITVDQNYNNPVTTAVREFGEDNFYKAVADINTYFAREDLKKLVTEVDTPLLNQRIETDYVFTPVEIAEYMREFGYTPTSLTNQTNTVSNKIPKELEAFYTKNFTSSSMGGFCGLLPNIFGAIGIFFSALGKAADLVNKLKNFAMNFSLTALIDQLKNNILNVIDKTVEKVKNVIENFSMENVLNDANKFINDIIGKEFARVKETAEKFFDGTAVEEFKDKVKALIDYAVGIFKDPKIEEIQYLMFRFCGFIAQVESGLNGLKDPLSDFVNTYKQSQSTLAANSAYNTGRAVDAGAIRYDANKRKEGINNGIKRAKDNKSEWQEPYSSGEYEGVTKWNDGAGDDKISFEFSNKFEWQEIDVGVRAKLMRVQKEFGTQLQVIKGNSNARDDLTETIFEDEFEDIHDSGKAVDVKWSGYNITTREKFIEIAIRNGFSGIGRYSNFVHLDVGPRREWEVGLTEDDPKYAYTHKQEYTDLYGSNISDDAKIIYDVYEGNYKQGDVVSFQGSDYVVNDLGDEGWELDPIL